MIRLVKIAMAFVRYDCTCRYVCIVLRRVCWLYISPFPKTTGEASETTPAQSTARPTSGSGLLPRLYQLQVWQEGYAYYLQRGVRVHLRRCWTHKECDQIPPRRSVKSQATSAHKTSISCRCITANVLQRKVDAQCNKLVTELSWQRLRRSTFSSYSEFICWKAPILTYPTCIWCLRLVRLE